MKTYLKLQFSSNGVAPSIIIKKLEDEGWRPILGDRDFVINWGVGESIGSVYLQKLDDLHKILKGTGVRYTLYSTK